MMALLRRRAQHGPVIARGPHGARVLVDPINPPEVSVYLWGTYEAEVVWALERLLRPGQVAVDVGANCGVLSVVMGKLNGDAPVIAVDPSAVACARVVEQSQLNGVCTTPLNVALGSHADTCQYFEGQIGIGVLPAADRAFTTENAVTVTVACLDAILDAHAPDGVCAIKIDSDGSEAEILRGGVDTLSKWRPALIFEMFVDGMRRRGDKPGDLMNILDQQDYEVFAPRMCPQSAWRASPPVLDRFEPTSKLDLVCGRLDCKNLVALPAGAEGDAWRADLLTPFEG